MWRLVIGMQCDRLYGWKSAPDSAIREAFKRQKDHVMKEFDDRSNQVFLQLNEQVRLALHCSQAAASDQQGVSTSAC